MNNTKKASNSTLSSFSATPLRLAVATLAGSYTSVGLAQQVDEKTGFSLMLEEVVVTAQKREESSLTVPITVNTFTADDIVLTGVRDIEDIDNFIPGVEIGNGSATQVGVTVRGVRSPNISSGGDPSVATFYDGTYLPRAATSIPFTDVARIEVLKGPQGTLFGRNATAGVINIVPNKPTFEDEGFVGLRLGNYSHARVEGMVNTALSDRVAMRGNVFFHERDGVIKNVAIGDDIREEKVFFGRLSLRYDLSSDTRLQLAADYEDRDESPNYSIGVSRYAYSTDPFSRRAANDVVGRTEDRTMFGTSLQLDHSFNDNLDLFGILSYREWETENLQDEDGTAQPRRYLDSNNIEDSNIVYSEVRLNFRDDRWDVIVGANYSVEDVYQRTDLGVLADSYMQFVSGLLLPEVGIQPTLDDHAWDIFANNPEDFWPGVSAVAGGAVLPPSFSGTYFTETMDNTGDFTNLGVFTDATYQLTDNVRLIAGLRYSYDKKQYSWQTFASGLDYPFEPFRVAFDPSQTGADPADYLSKFERSKTWRKTTGRLVVDWAFADNAKTYLSYATGFKSGGFDGQVFSGWVQGAYDPEDMTNIEWGIKGDFFGDRLRIEAAVFSQKLDGQQFSVDTKESPEDPTAQPTIVSQDLDTLGVEVILQWRVTDTLRLTGMTTMRDIERTPLAYFDSAGRPAGGTTLKEKTNSDYTLRLDWTPEIAYGDLLVHIDWVSESPKEGKEEPIYTTGRWYFKDKRVLSTRIAWQNEANNLELALWGENLLDEQVARNPDGFAADNLGVYRTFINDPRTYGVEARYFF